MSCAIEVGQRWLQKRTGRAVIVLETRVRNFFVAWHYEDEHFSEWHKSLERAFGEWGMFVRLPVCESSPRLMRAR